VSAPLVHIVDDDAQVRASTSFLLRGRGYATEIYASGEEFLHQADLNRGCVLLDLRMPGMNGFEVQRALIERGAELPVIMLSGHGDIKIAVEAMKLGAMDFLEKPYGEHELIDALTRGCEASAAKAANRAGRAAAVARIETLSGREREVLQGLVAGHPNKGIARLLGLSVRTIEMHRARMLASLGVGSLAEAVRIAVAADLPPLE